MLRGYYMAVAGAKAQGGEIPTDSLIWHYAFDNNGNDSSGNSNTLSSDGGITYGTNRHNVSNKCAYFDGDARFYRVDGINGTFTKKATFCFWIKPSQTGSSIFVLNGYQATNYTKIYWDASGNFIVSDVVQSIGANTINVASPTVDIFDGDWHFVEVFIDREANDITSGFSVKIDLETQPFVYNPYVKLDTLFTSFIYIIGSYLTSLYFTGYLDDFRYYTRKLTSGEDTALLNE